MTPKQKDKLETLSVKAFIYLVYFLSVFGVLWYHGVIKF